MKSQEATATLEQIFAQVKAQWGPLIKGYWFYEPDPCPGCGRIVDAAKHEGKDTLSLNAFIYRQRGILIGYLLCGRCAKQVMQAGQTQPPKEIPLHKTIENNLIKAYLQHFH